jgi:RNAse (barnase) inhibitor barstar
MSTPTAGDRGVVSRPVKLAPLTEEAATAICAHARSVGYDCVRVDLTDCEEKAEFLTRTAEAFVFPRWFGHNWDALADCLTDLGWRPAPGYVVVFEHASALQEHAPEVFDTALAILDDVAAAWRARGAPFLAFVSARPARDIDDAPA